MTEKKQSFFATIASYPRTFWVANTMEIFERMSWYGWFTVMALYVTGSVETGGLGFTTETRGMLQAVVPCILYLLPVLTGALADRFGFKRTFIIAYSMMIVAYYLLGQFTTLPTFFMAFLFVAVSAATFKPVVVGTVAKVTDESNSSMGFGIFYMMVNMGGFAGPIVAGYVRGWGWENVFIACSFWACVNLLIVIFLYKEPKIEGVAEDRRTLKKVGEDLVEVLGNLRFGLTVGVAIVSLMVASALSSMEIKWFTWNRFGVFLGAWLVLNVLYDLALPAGSGRSQSGGGPKRFFLFRRMHCSNWRFALFLLIMSGFWTSFNQIFYTMPEYIRDFTDTRPMIRLAESVFGESDPDDPNVGVASKMATINDDERAVIVRRVTTLRGATDGSENANRMLLCSVPRKRFDTWLSEVPDDVQRKFAVTLKTLEEAASKKRAQDEAESEEAEGDWKDAFAEAVFSLSPDEVASILARAKAADGEGWRASLENEALIHTAKSLIGSKVRIPPPELKAVLATDVDTETAVNRIITGYRQVNPEFIVNIDALAIVIFQVLISFLMVRFHRFTTMVVGMVIAAVGIGFSFFAGDNGMLGTGGSICIVALGLFTFAIGEMMASPTSQEYVGRIAPRDKVALYMGYYFVAVALGNLFGGIISGQLYGKLARDMGRPDLMWAAFGGIMLATAMIFLLYNKLALPNDQANTLTDSTA